MMDFDLASLLFLGSVPIILGIVQMFKQWVTDTRYYPIIAVVAGILLNLIIGISLGKDPTSLALMGLIAGLTASGLYSAVSTYREGNLADKDNRPGGGT